MRRRNEAGLTLVELLVTMVIAALLLTSLTASALTVMRIARADDQRVEDVGRARTAANAVVRTLRAAVRRDSTSPLLEVARDEVLAFVANLGGHDGPVRVRYELDASGELRELRWEPDPGSVPPFAYSGAPTVRVLARNVTALRFVYFDRDRCADLTSCPPLDTTADPDTGLSAADRNDVDLVTITVSVRGPVRPEVSPSTVTARVWLRNDAYVPEAG